MSSHKPVEPPEIIEVPSDSDQVKCNGGEGPMGHPVVWYTFDGKDSVTCWYCSRLFLKKT
ncbi:MAG: zinc-finger domain-containing protein [Micavibrio sp.]